MKHGVDESNIDTLKFIYQAMMWFDGFTLSEGNLLLFFVTVIANMNICGAFCEAIHRVWLTGIWVGT